MHYYDSKTGTEHLWDIGHLQMKVSMESNEVKSVVRGTELLGVAGGWIDRQPGLLAQYTSS